MFGDKFLNYGNSQLYTKVKRIMQWTPVYNHLD